MDTAELQSFPVKVDVGLALAAPAWDQFCRATGTNGRTPTAVISLKSQRLVSKSGAYRLEGAAADGSDVVAKRCRRATGRVERTVYERILPHLSVSRLRYYGYAEDAEGDFSWLFMEDAGGAKLLESQRWLAAASLARLHREAAPLVDQVALPERGAAHYQQHLTTARAFIATLETQDSRPVVAANLAVLQRLRHLLEQLDSKWDTICAPCATAPRTLVHGDFGKKNLRIRAAPTGTELVVLDWETAGWGPIGGDLLQMPVRVPRKSRAGKPLTWRGTVPLDAYAAHSLGAWDGQKFRDLAQIAAVGTLFRYVSSIRWAADHLRSGGTCKPMTRLLMYADELPQAMAVAGC